MESIIVWLIVGAAALYVTRRLYRAFSCRDRTCGCDARCGDCELAAPDKEEPEEGKEQQ